MAKKKIEETKNEAIKALDEQIVQQRAKLSFMATSEDYGVDCDAYHNAMGDLVKLCEARAKLSDSETNYLKDGVQRKIKINPNTIIAGTFGLAQIGLLAYMEREHVLPKCVGRVLDSAKEIFKRGE